MKVFYSNIIFEKRRIDSFSTQDPVIKISLGLFSFSGLDGFDLIVDNVTFFLLWNVGLIAIASFVTLYWLFLFWSGTDLILSRMD